VSVWEAGLLLGWLVCATAVVRMALRRSDGDDDLGGGCACGRFAGLPDDAWIRTGGDGWQHAADRCQPSWDALP
jgi:hypothetical protein